MDGSTDETRLVVHLREIADAIADAARRRPKAEAAAYIVDEIEAAQARIARLDVASGYLLWKFVGSTLRKMLAERRRS